MNDALYIAATGMQAQQLNVDTIANNLANLNTVGFKKSRVSFSDLVAREVAVGAPASAVEPTAGELLASARTGSGVGVSGVARLFDLGELKQTGSAMDLAIQGDGFLEVVLADGSRAFSRGGTLKLNADGQLADEAGNALRPGIAIPSDATGLEIEADGRVTVTIPGQANAIELGRLELVRFTNPGALAPLGASEFRATEGSGEAIQAQPREDGVGTLAQGFLEGSNVKMVDEMVSLMVAQRAYEANAKVIQASDELLGMVNSLRR